MLVEAAQAAGANPSEARQFLASRKGTSEIKAAQRVLRRAGICGIPTIFLGGAWQLPSGAIGKSVIVDALRAVESEGGATGSLFAQPLGIPSRIMRESLALP